MRDRERPGPSENQASDKMDQFFTERGLSFTCLIHKFSGILVTACLTMRFYLIAKWLDLAKGMFRYGIAVIIFTDYGDL